MRRVIAICAACAGLGLGALGSMLPAHAKAVEILPPGAVNVKHAGVHPPVATPPVNGGGKAKP